MLSELDQIGELLKEHFDLPEDFNVNRFIVEMAFNSNWHVITHEENGEVVGFLIYTINKFGFQKGDLTVWFAYNNKKYMKNSRWYFNKIEQIAKQENLCLAMNTNEAKVKAFERLYGFKEDRRQIRMVKDYDYK